MARMGILYIVMVLACHMFLVGPGVNMDGLRYAITTSPAGNMVTLREPVGYCGCYDHRRENTYTGIIREIPPGDFPEGEPTNTPETTKAELTRPEQTTTSQTTTAEETTGSETTTAELETTLAEETTVSETTIAEETTVSETTIAEQTTALETTIADETTSDITNSTVNPATVSMIGSSDDTIAIAVGISFGVVTGVIVIAVIVIIIVAGSGAYKLLLHRCCCYYKVAPLCGTRRSEEEQEEKNTDQNKSSSRVDILPGDADSKVS